MKYPLPIKVLFAFIILLTILGLIVKISFGASVSTTLYSLIPTAVILYLGFLLVRKGQKKKENYYSKFSNSNENS
jgi:threonine/homoserine/homoserine lactone efflux protein